MSLVKSIIANLGPIMMHFNALDVNVCRSEEVISLYFDAQCIKNVPHAHKSETQNMKKRALSIQSDQFCNFSFLTMPPIIHLIGPYGFWGRCSAATGLHAFCV